MTDASTFTAVVCTNRPARALGAVECLLAQEGPSFEIVVVDDAATPSSDLVELMDETPRVRVVRAAARGLSRARNAGWRAATTPWVVYVDDDVAVEPGWALALRQTLDEQHGVDLVSCDVRAAAPAGTDDLVISEHRVTAPARIRGRWTRPWEIGLTFCLAIKCTALEQLGGFDERLGPGVPAFPSAEDMDLNYRFLRAGGTAYATPAARAVHDQWRTAADLPLHFRGYMAGWTGFAMKQLRQGDVVGGLWLWTLGVEDLIRMTGSAARRRSMLRARVALQKLRGLLSGTYRALVTRW